jgi:crotonobetainyl-CoA:carnitine CoA-transferase CaiB-like acyl-CoA transferase
MDTEFLKSNDSRLSCAPTLGEHNESVLAEVGLTSNEIIELKSLGII